MELKLKTCCIRPWRMDDASSLQRYADNRRIWLNVRDIFPHPYTLANAEFFLGLVAKEKPLATFAIATELEAVGCDWKRWVASVFVWARMCIAARRNWAIGWANLIGAGE
jgi:hypothetical protein